MYLSLASGCASDDDCSTDEHCYRAGQAGSMCIDNAVLGSGNLFSVDGSSGCVGHHEVVDSVRRRTIVMERKFASMSQQILFPYICVKCSFHIKKLCLRQVPLFI